MSKIVLLDLGVSAANAEDAINVSESFLNDQAVVNNVSLSDKGVTSVGGMCADKSGNLYVTDPAQHIVLKINESGEINTVAGVAGSAGNNSALQRVPGADARFNAPRGLACDKSGNIYVADSGNNQIRMISDGKVDVYAGNGAQLSGLVDASSDPFQSRFNNPYDVAVDNQGTVYVADTDNHAIRKISGGKVVTIAGGNSAADESNVKASRFIPFCDSPKGISVNSKGEIILCDSNNSTLKKITPSGWIYRHSGSGIVGNDLALGSDESAFECQYVEPISVDIDLRGNQYVVDLASSIGSRLVFVDPNGSPSNVVDLGSNAVTSNPAVAGVAVSPAGKVFVSISA